LVPPGEYAVAVDAGDQEVLVARQGAEKSQAV
jgi:hypothetical protein